MWSVCIKELRQFFSNLSGYIAIILFLVITGLFLFFLPNSSILDYGYATLDKFFELSPWVLMFLLPAITMRTFSDEFKTGTIELLKTSPLRPSQIVWGKYFSVLFVLLFVIIPTCIYIITIKSLSATGNIDMGAISGSYLGLFLLGAVFAAISICCSSFTSNAVVAFLLGAFVCLVIYYGFSSLSRIDAFSGGIDYFLEMVGIDFHYQSISRGVIDTRDVIYFLSLIVFFLFITEKNIQQLK
ncbi:MAG: ABC transporter permease [Ferruginibacter sp.]|nr:ABC transporter permease [Ferruginibacter sp.]